VLVFSSARLCPLLLALVGACATQPATITKLVGGRQIATRSVDADAYEHAMRAMLYEEQERWQDAAAELERALAFDGDSPELHAQLAELFLRMGKLKQAAVEAKASLALGSSTGGLLASAHVQRAQGDLPGAVAALRKATNEVDFQASDDDAESVYLELAEAELQMLDLPSARNTLESLCQAEPGSGTGRMRLTAIAWALGDTAKAEAQLRAALAEEPNHIEALAALAWLQAALGKNDEARQVFRDALDRSEGALEIGAAFARFLVGIGASKDAEQVADDLAVPDSSLDAETLVARVELERSARRFARGLAMVSHAAELGIAENPKTRIPLLRATLLQDLDKPDEALAVLIKVSKDSPLYFEARLRAAELLRRTGKSDEAIRLVEDAAAAVPGDRAATDVDAAVAVALLEEKRWDPAAGIARLEKALVREPDDIRTVMTLAAIQERLGRWQDALALADKILGKNPGSVEALNFWGFVAADHDHALDLALRRLQVASALDPGSGGLIDSLGWVHFHRHDLDKAGGFLEQAARLEPADPEIQWHLGSLYAERKETERATTAFRRALGFAPDDRLRHKVEDSLARLGQSKTAKQ
jgi:tetratricopeptide (TPR) repeat protein